MNRRSFSDPETVFEIVRSETPRWDDGFEPGEPTGEIRCPFCGMSAAAPEYIPHPDGCSQSDVRSEYYYRTHRVD